MTSNEKCNLLMERVVELIHRGVIRHTGDIQHVISYIISSSLLFQGLKVDGVERSFETNNIRVMLFDEEHGMCLNFQLAEQLFYDRHIPSMVTLPTTVKDNIVWPKGLFDFEEKI